MILFPAIDILNGKCVRLLYGDYSKVTEYGNPVSMARRWAECGAEYLHIVDLDAAASGTCDINEDIIKELLLNVNIPVQIGGGIRTMSDIEHKLSMGVSRVILGTVCCDNPETVCAAIKEFGGERIVCGIDVKSGKVATNGWLTDSNIMPADLGRAMHNIGVRYAVYTDITKDGALSGVNVSGCKEMAVDTGLNIIASGGVSSVDDIRALRREKVYGAILGRALYENTVNLQDALKIAKE